METKQNWSSSIHVPHHITTRRTGFGIHTPYTTLSGTGFSNLNLNFLKITDHIGNYVTSRRKDISGVSSSAVALLIAK